MPVKGKSPTTIQWYPTIQLMNTLEKKWVRLEREREREGRGGGGEEEREK